MGNRNRGFCRAAAAAGLLNASAQMPAENLAVSGETFRVGTGVPAAVGFSRFLHLFLCCCGAVLPQRFAGVAANPLGAHPKPWAELSFGLRPASQV
ncbi:MAG: hypothetical protein IJU44_05255 [Kiritimatiellae bacterium]|nr:hypothetical protein [Kiritimatiellia bacterium]